MNKEIKKNREIKSRTVRVVLEDGTQLGIMRIDDALKEASNKNLDLVEISPNAKPPVCKILNYSKLAYQNQKKDRKNKSNKSKPLKTIIMGYKTSDHDIDIKMSQARKFLSKGHPVKVSISFRGREAMFKDILSEKINILHEELSKDGFSVTNPKFENKNVSFVANPSA